jgi:hypothetical protein
MKCDQNLCLQRIYNLHNEASRSICTNVLLSIIELKISYPYIWRLCRHFVDKFLEQYVVDDTWLMWRWGWKWQAEAEADKGRTTRLGGDSMDGGWDEEYRLMHDTSNRTSYSPYALLNIPSPGQNSSHLQQHHSWIQFFFHTKYFPSNIFHIFYKNFFKGIIEFSFWYVLFKVRKRIDTHENKMYVP